METIMEEKIKLEATKQDELGVIVIADTSGSMSGEKIGQVNDGIRKAIDWLKEFNADDEQEAKAKFACLKFATGAEWVNPKKPYDEPENYVWQDVKAIGNTDFGRACTELQKILTVEEKGGWMKGRGGIAPVLLLISDGQPTDSYDKQLEDLKKRGWYIAALKTAIAVGDDCDYAMLKDFTGNDEAIFQCDVFSDLSTIIKVLIVRSSQAKSKDKGGEGGTVVNQADTIAQIKEDVHEAVNFDDGDNFDVFNV